MKRLLLGVVLVVGGVCNAQAQQGWNAKWIAAPWSTVRDGAEMDGSKPMPIFRHEFVVRGPVTRAELRIAGLGQFEARIGSKDGVQPVGPHGLHQAWTDYKKTVTYESYDVTAQMKPGPHVLGIMLGNGMYNVQRSLSANGKSRFTKFEGSFGAPKLIAELSLKYADGHTEIIATDTSWKAARGPVMFTSTYGGEDFDARKNLSGWNSIGYKDTDWYSATVVDGPGGTLMAALAPEVVQSVTHSPVKVTELAQDKRVYDLGQNFAGVPYIHVRGAEGQILKLIPGELLNPDGSVSQRSSGSPMWWSYTLRGSPKGEDWQPQFSYYGFRYLQAEWSGSTPAAVPLKIDNINGIEWHTASPVTGSFESSSTMLNAIHKLIVASMHNNEVSLMTDCPHREKLGWLEETHLIAPGLMFNNDVRGLFAATEKNIADAQHDDGNVPTIAPQYVVFPPKYAVFNDSPEWGSASVLAPWTAYRFYGDKAELDRSYPTMKAYVKYLQSRAQDGIVAYGLGDWYDIGSGEPGMSKLTTLGVTGTLMLYEDAVTMQKIASLLGHADDAASYAALADREKNAYNKRFWNAQAGYYDTGSQTANSMPLALGIVPQDRRATVLAYVIADIHAHNDHVTTGEVGYPYMLRALMEAGRNDVVMAMMMRKDPPSYGSQLAAGATSLTEAWDANPMHSQDHFMLGGAEEWFYRGLGGIDFDLSRNADEQITIRPRLVAGVDWVKCGYNSTLGKIESDWKRSGNEIVFEITVPAGGTAKIFLPGILVAPNVKQDKAATVLSVGAGSHRFTVKNVAP